MCMYMLPKDVKDNIKKKWLSYEGWGRHQTDIEGMLSFMYSKQPSDTELKEVYRRFTILDKYRKESTFDVVKEFYPELEKYFNE